MSNEFSLSATAEPRVATTGLNIATVFFLSLAVVGVSAGLYSFYAGHHNVYNNTREVPWGILISSYAFFAITSTGLCLLAAISHIFGGNRLAPLANRMVWLSLITIIGGFILIGLELESPWRMAIWNIISPNLTSNIWWMGTLYGMAVGFMIVEFFLILTKRYKLAVTLGVLGALAEIAANTNLGAVFATLSARPFWYGAQLPVYFLASSFLSGAAAAVLFTNFAYQMRKQNMNKATFQGVQSAAKILTLMLTLVTVATAWRAITFYVGGTEAGRAASDVLLAGPLATNFWIFEVSIGIVFPLVLLAFTKMESLPAMSAASLMALVGQFFSRYDLVVAGQIIPQYAGWDNLPAYFSYVPSVAEFLLTFAGIGFVGAMFILGERFFGRAFEHQGEH